MTKLCNQIICISGYSIIPIKDKCLSFLKLFFTFLDQLISKINFTKLQFFPDFRAPCIGSLREMLPNKELL